jgi:hypothetical protein
MTPEAQRIAIAKACEKWPLGWPSSHISETERLSSVPDYLNDLNAMHEAETAFGNCEIEWHKYAAILLRCIEPHRHAIHATAAQRAEAFLRTLGKWEE